MNQQIVSKISQYLKSLPINKAWVFGSFARNEEDKDSDIDLLIEFMPNVKIGLQYFRMIADLEEICGRRIDLVESGMLHPDVLPFINNDRILIYERRS